MIETQAKHLLWTIAAVAAAGVLLTIGLAIGLPLEASSPSAIGHPATAPAGSHGDVPPLSAFAAVWDRDLRRPLTDAPVMAPPVVETQAPPEAAPLFHVLGTVVEPGHSMAMVIGPAGKPCFMAVGDAVAGGKIVAIAGDSVTFEYNGKRIVASIEKPAPLPNAPVMMPGIPRPVDDSGEQ